MLLANRLEVPDNTAAVLFDMDGVVLDTLSLDIELTAKLLRPVVGRDFSLDHHVIRASFPYEIPEFWRRVSAAIGYAPSGEEVDSLTAELVTNRQRHAAPVHKGIVELLKEARAAGIRTALVSNNPKDQITTMTEAAGLSGLFDVLVGNDTEGVRKKPAPDPYLEAARLLGTEPGRCVAIEDSLLGAASASAAGCFTVGVATGSADYRALSASDDVSVCYADFSEIRVSLGDEGVTRKYLNTPNEFVSHMVEHIAWRTGCSVDVRFTSDDWKLLGRMLGEEVRRLPRSRSAASALGMIDDGSCEVTLHDAASDSAATGPRPGQFLMSSSQQVDLDWFLSVRCEQMADGRPLLAMLEGLAAGGALDIEVTVASFEDPHHTWEAIFRGVGIAIDKLNREQDETRIRDESPVGDETPATEAQAEAATESDSESESESESEARPKAPQATQATRAVEKGWDVLGSSMTRAAMQRETAESIVRIDAAMAAEPDDTRVGWQVEVADSIRVEGLKDLLEDFARGAGLRLDVLFRATRLSSSHVVAEDIGMVLGRVTRQIALERMEGIGINGAGSSILDVEQLRSTPVQVGVSMEGRKFCKYVPLVDDYQEFRRRFLIGRTLPGGVFSEDLDDFVDGFAGGMHASVMVHVGSAVTAEEGWPLVFRGMGRAVREVLAVNRSRQRLIAGVKGTLA